MWNMENMVQAPNVRTAQVLSVQTPGHYTGTPIIGVFLWIYGV
jgi:hypothetical protein